jgi:hypothetical protein
MRQRILVALLLLLTPTALRADPIRIVDTGAGPTTLAGFHLGGLQWSGGSSSGATKAPVSE